MAGAKHPQVSSHHHYVYHYGILGNPDILGKAMQMFLLPCLVTFLENEKLFCAWY
jgi:hypothetical protein